MATISWGKPKIFIGFNEGDDVATMATNTPAVTTTGKWFLLNTPVEDSTQLTGTQGDKTEATIEGGEAEATNYKAATFELAMQVRMAIDTYKTEAGLESSQERKLPPPFYKAITGNDAWKEYTAKNVKLCLIPKEEEAPGFYCPDCTVSIMESYTAADGAMWELTIAPNASATEKAIQFGQYYCGNYSDYTAGPSGNQCKFKQCMVAKGKRPTSTT